MTASTARSEMRCRGVRPRLLRLSSGCRCPRGQRLDALPIASRERIGRREPGPTGAENVRQIEVRLHGILCDASRWTEPRLRERARERLEHGGAACRPGRKEFETVIAGCQA